MKTFKKSVDEIVDKKEDCPLNLSVIPNHMGINLCRVDSVAWQKQDDGQLTSLTVYFKPAQRGGGIHMTRIRKQYLTKELRKIDKELEKLDTKEKALIVRAQRFEKELGQ